MSSFETDLERGKYGEGVFQVLARNNNYTLQDVRDIKEYQEIDVDFITTNGTKVEVKTDFKAKETGNITAEDSVFYYSDLATAKGGLGKTEADVIAYVVVYNNWNSVIYFIDVEDLRRIAKTCQKRTIRTYYKQEEIYLINIAENRDYFREFTVLTF